MEKAVKILRSTLAICLLLSHTRCGQDPSFVEIPHREGEEGAEGNSGNGSDANNGNGEHSGASSDSSAADDAAANAADAASRDKKTSIQGSSVSGTDVSETFWQEMNRLLDIVLVIDNSSSMKEEQDRLSQKLEPLLSFIDETDWRIGVTTTDPKDGCLKALLQKTDAGMQKKFQQAVQAGIKGSDTERGLLQAVNAIKGDCLNTPWVRSNSALAVLFVTDEDNCSNGKKCANEPDRSASYLYDYLAAIRQPGKNAKVYGILWHPSMASCGQAKEKANTYASLIERTGGIWGPICDPDYTDMLLGVSKSIAANLATKFTLKGAPLPGTLKVFINEAQMPSSGYTVSGNVLEFALPPHGKDKIRVEYQMQNPQR